jgi:hypothetical protein
VQQPLISLQFVPTDGCLILPSPDVYVPSTKMARPQGIPRNEHYMEQKLQRGSKFCRDRKLAKQVNTQFRS